MIHLGIIGYGYWGPNLTRNFVEIPESTVVHVADLDPARLALARSRYPGVKVSTDSREMLKDPRVDAVAIATPVSTHYELAREVLAQSRRMGELLHYSRYHGGAPRLLELRPSTLEEYAFPHGPAWSSAEAAVGE